MSHSSIQNSSTRNSSIQKICIIGSGVMGSGIAAQIANSQTSVVLLDIVDEKSSDPSSVANNALQKMHTQKPPALSDNRLAKYITTGNIDDDLELIKDCQLVIEVIVEKLDIKHLLYEKILPYLQESAVIASNTSTIKLQDLKKTLPQNVQNKFIITHFFNPPRYMELLELITDKQTSHELIKPVRDFITYKLGKTIVNCNDAPGFIANRVGCFLLELVVRKAISAELNPVIIDQVFHKLLGFPSTAIFGLYDLIGHDVMHLISKSLLENLEPNDKYHEIYQELQLLSDMKDKNLLGRKVGAGFYKVLKQGNKRHKYIIDTNYIDTKSKSNIDDKDNIISANQAEDYYHKNKSNIDDKDNIITANQAEDYYQDIAKLSLPEIDSLKSFFGDKAAEPLSKYKDFILEVLSIFFEYVHKLVPEVAKQSDIDQAMRLGYNLRYGPFELCKKLSDIGVTPYNGEKLIPENVKLPYDHNSVIYSELEEIDASKITNLLYSSKYDKNILVLNSKTNVLDEALFEDITKAVDLSESHKRDLIIINKEGSYFSVGANLKYIYQNILDKKFETIEQFIDIGQKTMIKIKYASINVISVASAYAMGGGCEILLHSDFVIGHQNLTAGLVELSVGLLPGWGGVKEMFFRAKGDKKLLVKNLSNILLQHKTSSADSFFYEYNASGVVNMHKNFALIQALEYKLPPKDTIVAAGDVGKAEKQIAVPDVKLVDHIDSSKFSSLQLDILKLFQEIIDNNKGDFITEKELLLIEKNKFLKLTQNPETLETLKQFALKK